MNENASGRVKSMEMCLRQAYFLTPKLQDNFGNWKYSNCKAAPADKKKPNKPSFIFVLYLGERKNKFKLQVLLKYQ